MKKILLLAAAFCAANFAMNADDVANLVANGNFENTNYEQAVPGEYTWDPVNTWENLSVLPGWQLSTGGPWNGTACILAGDEYAGDGDIRPEDDMQHLHIRGYNDNGWTNIKVYQIVKNLVPGRQYTLDFVIAHNWADGANWTPDPDFGFVIAEVDGEGAGRELMKQTNMGEGQDFEYFDYSFTAPASEIYLEFYYGNSFYEGNKHEDHWMDLDLVRIYSAEGDEQVPELNAVNSVINDNDAPVELYNLQGVRVNANDALKGIYIQRQGNKATKVIF